MSKDGDAELVRRCRRGDQDACYALLSEYEKPVFNVAFRMLHDVDDAQDVTQTVFMKVFENLDRYDPSHRFFSWIYRIAINESINLAQQRSRQRPLEGHEPSQAAGPEDACGRAEVGAAIESVLMTIKDEYRTVLVLRHFADLTYEEIGVVIDLPVKTVKSRLFTARRLLRDGLLERGHLQP
jgi:RNA polymerase sigma-70 factor (ECF subfamily)